MPPKFSPIGLALGESTLAAIQYTRRGGVWSLHAFAAVHGIDPGDELSVAAAIRHLIEADDFRGRDAVTALPAGDVEIRPVTLAKTFESEDSDEFWTALREEARVCLLYPLHQAVIDYLPLHGAEAIQGRGTPILLVAARRARVEAHVARLRAGGLRCAHIDIGPCAAARALALEDGTSAVVSIQASSTMVSLTDGPALRFCRVVKTGLAAILQRLCEAIGATPAQGRRMLAHYGIALPGAPSSAAPEWPEGSVPPELIPGRFYELCVREVDALARELQRTLHYFSLQPFGSHVTRVALLGELTIPGLAELLEQRIGVPVSGARCRAALRCEAPGWHDETFAVAAGLALRDGLV